MRTRLAPAKRLCWDASHAARTPCPEPACRVRSTIIFRSNRRAPRPLFRDVVVPSDLKVKHKPVVLVDLFSETGGLPLMKRHPVRQRYRMVELQRWRDKRGLKFHLQPAHWPVNARLADGVVIAALEAGLDPDRYLRRGFAAVWEDQLNLADPATIVGIADEAGLPGKRLVERSGSDEIVRGLRTEFAVSLQRTCLASPGYGVLMARFWGQDRIEIAGGCVEVRPRRL